MKKAVIFLILLVVADLFPQQLRFIDKRRLFHCIPDGNKQAVQVDRLGNVIVRPFLQGFHGSAQCTFKPDRLHGRADGAGTQPQQRTRPADARGVFHR